MVLLFLVTTLTFSQQPQWRLAKGSEGIAIYDLDFSRPNPEMYAKGSKWLMSRDKGETWTERYPWNALGRLRVHPANSKIIYENESSSATSSNDFYITNIDTGARMIFSGRGIPSFALAVDYMDKQTVYVGVADFLLRTTQGYKDVKNITPPGGRALDITIAPSNDSILVAVCEGEVYKSVDKGITWTSIRYGGVPLCAAVNPANPDIVAIGYKSYGAEPRGIQITTDGGVTWQVRYNGIDTTDLAPFSVNQIFFNPKISEDLYVSISSTSSSSQGIYRSNDLGLNWFTFNTGLPMKPGITTIVLDTLNDRLYAGMYTLNQSINGVYIYDGKPTGVKEDKTQLITTFSLRQNYPNPFNPTTMISYQIAVSGRVALKVYDILGREVATLVDGYEPAGAHAAEFNGSNLSSGIYFYRLTSDRFTDVKKMVLQK